MKPLCDESRPVFGRLIVILPFCLAPRYVRTHVRIMPGKMAGNQSPG